MWGVKDETYDFALRNSNAGGVIYWDGGHCGEKKQKQNQFEAVSGGGGERWTKRSILDLSQAWDDY